MEKETYINNMNKFLKELDATNEQITVITNVYIAYLESFIKKINGANSSCNIRKFDALEIFDSNFKKNISTLIYYSDRDELIFNYIKGNIKNINIAKLDEQPDLKDLKKTIVNNTYNREIYCLTKCFNYKKFHLKLYALANILGIEKDVNKVKYSDEDKDNVKYSNIRCAIHGVE